MIIFYILRSQRLSGGRAFLGATSAELTGMCLVGIGQKMEVCPDGSQASLNI